MLHSAALKYFGYWQFEAESGEMQKQAKKPPTSPFKFLYKAFFPPSQSVSIFQAHCFTHELLINFPHMSATSSNIWVNQILLFGYHHKFHCIASLYVYDYWIKIHLCHWRLLFYIKCSSTVIFLAVNSYMILKNYKA